MSISVGEINFEATPEATPAPQGGAPGAAPRPDPNEIRLILRRDDERRERLWVD